MNDRGIEPPAFAAHNEAQACATNMKATARTTKTPAPSAGECITRERAIGAFCFIVRPSQVTADATGRGYSVNLARHASLRLRLAPRRYAAAFSRGLTAPLSVAF